MKQRSRPWHKPAGIRSVFIRELWIQLSTKGGSRAMLITGNRILDALDILKERVKTLDTQFKASLFRFEDDEGKRDPRDFLGEFESAQEKIARLQEAQAAYNLRVEGDGLGGRMTLQRGRA